MKADGKWGMLRMSVRQSETAVGNDACACMHRPEALIPIRY